MPVYEFLCKTCDELVAEVRPASQSSDPAMCKICDNAMKRLYSNVGISFNGNGFYSTDK